MAKLFITMLRKSFKQLGDGRLLHQLIKKSYVTLEKMI